MFFSVPANSYKDIFDPKNNIININFTFSN